MKSLGNKMRAADIIQKDKIARKIFVNLYLDDQKRLTYLCKEPFDSIVKVSESLTGGAEDTLFEHIYQVANYLCENRNYAIFRLPKIPSAQKAQQIASINYVL